MLNLLPELLGSAARFQSRHAAWSFFVLALFITGCATPTGGSNAWAQYHAAIADAAVVKVGEDLPLQPLPENSSVEVVSWVTDARTPCKEFPCDFEVTGSRLWVTLSNEVQRKCQTWGLQGDALRVRLEQLLGLPPDTPPQFRKTRFVRLQVPHTSIDRPCLGVDASVNSAPRCTLRAKQGRTTELQLFVMTQMAYAFVASGPAGSGGPGYPFTRLGYTYDWSEDGRQHGNYGASEFVLAVGTKGRAVAKAETDEYCSLVR